MICTYRIIYIKKGSSYVRSSTWTYERRSEMVRTGTAVLANNEQ
jgi:hypothetical protein